MEAKATVTGSAYSVRHYGAANAVTILRSNGQFFTLNEDETRWLADQLAQYQSTDLDAASKKV